MDPHEEKELEESLEYMRKQFRALTDDIKIPDSLRADLLKKQLELMEAEQEEREERAHSRKRQPRRVRRDSPKASPRSVVIPLRTLVSLAACVVVVSVSFLSFQLGKASGSVTAEPSSAEASPDEMLMGSPALDMEDASDEAPMEAGFGAPTPEEAQAAPAPAILQAAPQEASPELAMADETEVQAVPSSEVLPRSADGLGVVSESEVQGSAEKATDESTAFSNVKAGAFGNYLPKELPRGLAFSTAMDRNGGLLISYLNEDYSRQIQIAFRPNFDGSNLVDPVAPETYDLRLYAPPYTETVPEELAPMLNDPVFQWDDLTLSLVEARVFDQNGNGARGNFSVLFPDGTVAGFNVTGVFAQEVYEMILQMYG